jgi:rubrerythrin
MVSNFNIVNFEGFTMSVETISPTDEKLIDILEKQIAVEEKTLIELAEAEDAASEPAVRLILMELRLDTWKHKHLLQGIVEILTTTPCDMWSAKVQRYIDRIKLDRTLEAVLAKEKEMIDYVSQALENVKDPIASMIFGHLKHDEERHSRDLVEVIKLIRTAPLQTKKGQKGTDIYCPPDE